MRMHISPIEICERPKVTGGVVQGICILYYIETKLGKVTNKKLIHIIQIEICGRPNVKGLKGVVVQIISIVYHIKTTFWNVTSK